MNVIVIQLRFVKLHVKVYLLFDMVNCGIVQAVLPSGKSLSRAKGNQY